MNVIYLRYQTDQPQFHINFRYRNPDLDMDRVFNFSRNISETVNSSLERIRTNVEKEIVKNFRKKSNAKKRSKNEVDASGTKTADTPKVSVQLLKDNVPIDQDTCLASLFESYERLSFQLSDQKFVVAFNYPWVDSVSLPASILAGCYIYPTKLETQCCHKDNIQFNWFKGQEEKKGQPDEQIEWIPIGESFLYLVQTTDIGHKIKVVCTPKNGDLIGPCLESVSKCVVEAGPGPCPFEIRHQFTREHLEGRQFRVISYNILADLYCDSDYSRTVLFPYCPPYALAIDYRKQLLIRELFGYRGDIVCLQEVDSKVFDLDLEPLLQIAGYGGTFQQKGETGEGLAMFYNLKRFSLVERYGITIGENIPKLTIFDDLWQKIQNNDKLVERIVNRSTALQVTVIQCNETKKYLLVANTHLYFHPDADHVRLLQIGLSMKYVEFVYEQTKVNHKLTDDDVSIIFCGDFNSVPECGIYKLMTTNVVPEDFIDFQSNLEETVTGVTLRQPFNFKSAYSELKYSNFTPLFSAWIDYIFYKTDNLKVVQVVPSPSDEELYAHTAIPSIVFPSDHIAQISDLEWT